LIASRPHDILRRLLRLAAFGLLALFALIALAGARAAFAQDAATSGDAAASGDSAALIDGATTADSAGPGDAIAAGSDSSGDWQRADPDLSAESAAKVLELPQTACVENGVSIPCDERITVSSAPGTANDNPDDDGSQAASGSASAPQTFDDDTASAAPAESDWGTADDYANQGPIYGIPYGTVVSRGPIYGNPQIPPSMVFPFPPRPISAPLSQAARPSLSPGPWMTRPSMMMMSRPAGSPMAGGSFRFH
jgi:hypothetical protein